MRGLERRRASVLVEAADRPVQRLHLRARLAVDLGLDAIVVLELRALGVGGRLRSIRVATPLRNVRVAAAGAARVAAAASASRPRRDDPIDREARRAPATLARRGA